MKIENFESAEIESRDVYTVKEFAALRGVSQQAIYKQIDRSLKPYVITRDGQKYISVTYFDQFPDHISPQNDATIYATGCTTNQTNVDQPEAPVDQPKLTIKPSVEQPDQPGCKPVDHAENYREMLDILREQLREKDKLVEQLRIELEQLRVDNRLKDDFMRDHTEKLTALIENSQKIEAGRIMLNQLTPSTDQIDPVSGDDPEGKRSAGFFSRIFHRK